MPSAAFLKAASRLFNHEGGFSDRPKEEDPGGKTMFGITEGVARAHGYRGDMRFLPFTTAQEIAEWEYWAPIHGDDIPFPLAFQLYDFGFNSGPPTAVKFLQRLLHLPDDGLFGPVTLSKIKSLDQNSLRRVSFDLISARQSFQQTLRNWSFNSKGWTDRNFKNISFLLEDFSFFSPLPEA